MCKYTIIPRSPCPTEHRVPPNPVPLHDGARGLARLTYRPMPAPHRPWLVSSGLAHVSEDGSGESVDGVWCTKSKTTVASAGGVERLIELVRGGQQDIADAVRRCRLNTSG